VNVDWIIPCRYVEIHENLATMVGAGIDTLWPPELPATVQVTAAVRISGLPEELEEDLPHTARTLVRGPGGELVAEAGGEFAVQGEGAPEQRDWLQGFMVSVAISFEAAAEGTYTIEHIVDASSASVPMHVRVGSPL
jgi:hypothetical protein